MAQCKSRTCVVIEHVISFNGADCGCVLLLRCDCDDGVIACLINCESRCDTINTGMVISSLVRVLSDIVNGHCVSVCPMITAIAPCCCAIRAFCANDMLPRCI